MQEIYLRIKDCNCVKAHPMTKALFKGISWKKTNSGVENELKAYQIFVSRFIFEVISFEFDVHAIPIVAHANLGS